MQIEFERPQREVHSFEPAYRPPPKIHRPSLNFSGVFAQNLACRAPPKVARNFKLIAGLHTTFGWPDYVPKELQASSAVGQHENRKSEPRKQLGIILWTSAQFAILWTWFTLHKKHESTRFASQLKVKMNAFGCIIMMSEHAWCWSLSFSHEPHHESLSIHSVRRSRVYDFRSDVCRRAICPDFWHTQCLRLWKQKESVLIRFKMMRLINQKVFSWKINFRKLRS